MFNAKKPLGLVKNIRETSETLFNRINQAYGKFEKKIEGTMVENWLRFWKHVFRDYRDVSLDVVQDMKKRPTKAILVGTTTSLVTYFSMRNPNGTHFRDAYLRAANDVCLMPESEVRQETLQHLRYIEKCYNCDLIRHANLGVVSLIWVDNFSDKCAAFETQCSYLQLGYLGILDRIVDVGFLNNWWILAKKMTDYDINY